MWREFRRTTKQADLYWKIEQASESYTTEHGQVGTDNPQTFSDTPGPKGKEGTKAYVNAVDNCTFNMEREIRKKEEHGYIEYVDGKLVKKAITDIVFNKCLPKTFCAYKPQTSISDSAHVKIFKKGKARYSRKRDGMQELAVHHTWGWEIYTRRMDLATERFPLHIEQLEKLNFGVGTILTGEMICEFKDKDDFTSFAVGISRVCRSDPPEARKLIEDGEVTEPIFYVFDILFSDGQSLKSVKYDTRRAMFTQAIDAVRPDDRKQVDYVSMIKNINPDNWEETAKENCWEGFVIVDGDSLPGDKFFSFDGDAKRPKGHHKLKPVWEEDVVIYAGVKGTGKRLGRIGSVLVAQIHPDTGEWMRCGKVGSGFTDEDLDDLEITFKKKHLPIFSKEKEDEVDLNTCDGIVTMIEYGERQPKTQKFRFGVFMRTRTDKAMHECIAQRLAAEE